MEKTVIFRENQEFRADDPNNLQAYGSDSLDHVVYDAISPGTHYAGLTATKSGTTAVSVAIGRLFAGGMVYSLDDAKIIDLFNYLPTTTQKIVAVVVWGTTHETDVQSRDFLTDVTTNATEPKSVTMTSARVCQIDIVGGAESASPQPPSIPSTTLLVALVTLSTAGVVSIEMQTANELPQLRDVETRTGKLELWKTQTDPRVSTITSDLAKLGLSIKDLADVRLVREVAADVARLKDISKLPDDFSDYANDHFLDTAESNTSAVGYAARVNEGIRFPHAASAVSALALLNPIDASVAVANGFALPAWSSKTRMDNTDGYAGADYLSSFEYQTTQSVELEISRTRIRLGAIYTVCTNAGYLNGRDITLNTASNTFVKNGETFTYLGGVNAGNINTDHTWIRIQECWVDTYKEPYWQINTVTKTVTGAQISQVFLNSQDGWLAELGIYFHDIGASGSVQIMLCKADNGQPDLASVLASVTVAQADLKVYPTRTAVSIPPTYLQGGSRYAVVVQSGGQHSVASVSGSTIPQGTYFHYQSGAFQAVDSTRSLMFDLKFAYFGVSYLAVQLASLSLAGGICSIDILTKMICPASCQMNFEVQVNGTWSPLTKESASLSLLDSAPNLVPLRAVFVGTPDIMPGFGLTGSQVTVAKPAAAFVHYSVTRTLAAATTTVRVLVLVESFNAALHTVGCTLVVNGTEVPPSVTSQSTTDSGILKQFSFTVTSTTSYVIKLTGTTSDTTTLFHVAERTDISF
jgi:hypothetical protein